MPLMREAALLTVVLLSSTDMNHVSQPKSPPRAKSVPLQKSEPESNMKTDD